MANTVANCIAHLAKDKLLQQSEEAAKLLASNGMLIKRPLVLDHGSDIRF